MSVTRRGRDRDEKDPVVSEPSTPRGTTRNPVQARYGARTAGRDPAPGPARTETGDGDLDEMMGAALTGTPGASVQRQAAVQRRGADHDPMRIHDLAARGVAGPGSSLPHKQQIEASFGPHAAHLASARAHTGTEAASAAAGMGAHAYATGDDIALGTTDLHTVAHEAAHVVQQRAGVQLAGGVGSVGDAYEQNADAVADRVVRGESAADLLDPFAPSPGAAPAVQHKVVQRDIKSDLREAMDGWGTDESGIYTRLGRSTAAELRAVLADAALMSELRSELNQSEMSRALDLLRAPLADKLRLAMDGWGTDEDYIHRSLATASAAELATVAADSALVDRLESELSGDDLRSVLDRLSIPLDRKLRYAVSGWGTDEAYIFSAINAAPIAQVVAVAGDATLIALVDGDLSGAELHRWRGELARRIYLEGNDPVLALSTINGSKDARAARIIWVGALEVQRALLDAVIMHPTASAALRLVAFQDYWSVETTVVNGAAAWPPEALQQIHTQMKALPDQDTRSGVWRQLSLTGAALLTNRAAWNGDTGNFTVGANAAQNAATNTTDLSAAAAAGDSTIQVATPGAFWVGAHISIGDGANRELAAITAIAGSTYTLQNPLANAHANGEKLLPVSSEYGHGTLLTAGAAVGGTTLTVQEPARFAVGDTIALDRLGPNRDVGKITAIAGNQYTIDTALAHAHGIGEQVTPDDNTATREVNWLAATVRHEIAHSVETALGGVKGFTEGLGGWWTGTDFDSWAGQMSDPWATNDGSTISADDKKKIKEAIVAAMQSTPQGGQSLLASVTAPHPVVTHWAKQVPVMVAADACLSAGDGFYRQPQNIYADSGKRFSISWWYKKFMYHNEEVASQRVKDYGLYAPAEFFAEAYTVFYEEAGRPGVTDADHGRLIRNTTWRNWIRTNVHNRGQAPAGTGAGGSTPGSEGAQPGGAGYGKASGNPGP